MPGPINQNLVSAVVGDGPLSEGSYVYRLSYRTFDTVGDLPASGAYVGEVVTVKDDGDGKDALYSWREDEAWYKIADPDNVVPVVAYPTMHDLSSQADGLTTEFTLPAASVVSTMLLSVSGVVLARGAEVDGKDFTVSGLNLTFHLAPPDGANVLAYYVES